jgi:hypothetical protein
MGKTNPRPTRQSAWPPSGGTLLRSRDTGPPRYNLASLEGQSPPRVKFRLARGSDTPSSGTPPRSGARRPLARGPVSIESQAPPRASFRLTRGHHGPAASIPAPPTGAFNALTSAGDQVKGESTPLRAWESCPDTTPPTPVARPSPPLCDAVRRGQQPPRGTVPPTPVWLAHHPLEKGRRNPRREDARLLLARAGRRCDVRPVGAVTSVTISPVRPYPPPRRHLGHCITIPDVVEACGDGTPPRQPLCLVRPHVNGTLESSRGRPSNEQPLRHPPRSHCWTRTGHAMTPGQKRDSP